MNYMTRYDWEAEREAKTEIFCSYLIVITSHLLKYKEKVHDYTLIYVLTQCISSTIYDIISVRHTAACFTF